MKTFPNPARVQARCRAEILCKMVSVIALIGLTTVSVMFFLNNRDHRAELERTRAGFQSQLDHATAGLEQAKTEAATAAKAAGQDAPVELLKLRNEVAQLRPLKDKVQILQQENTSLRANTAARAQMAALGSPTQVIPQNGAVPPVPVIDDTAKIEAEADAATCIAQLKGIAGAKATWAIEYNKLAGDVPADSDLFGLNKHIEAKPICPNGGTYIAGAVNEKPRCTVAGHAY